MFVADLEIDHDRLAQLCRDHHVVRLEAFGSFASGEADADSDIDLLVTFDEHAEPGLGYVELRDALSELLGRPVDLLERRSIENSPNKYFRKYALEHVEQLYAA